MKTVLLCALVLLASCTRNPEKPLSPAILISKVDTKSFLSLAKDKQMFSQISQQLDLSKIEQVTGAGNVLIFMVKFKGDPNKIYAVNTLGSELLYSSQMKDEKNGTIGVMKNGEAIIIEFKDGVKTIRDINNTQFQTRFASEFHGGPGFCQREKGESFGACFKAESEEFCDLFVSCVALATQPAVVVVIGLACSCNV